MVAWWHLMVALGGASAVERAHPISDTRRLAWDADASATFGNQEGAPQALEDAAEHPNSYRSCTVHRVECTAAHF